MTAASVGADRAVVSIRIARALRAARARRRLSREQVAHDAQIAVQTYRRLERAGSRSAQAPNPTIDTLWRIIHVLQLDWTDLFGCSSRCETDSAGAEARTEPKAPRP